jgi:hypothetical protein
MFQYFGGTCYLFRVAEYTMYEINNTEERRREGEKIWTVNRLIADTCLQKGILRAIMYFWLTFTPFSFLLSLTLYPYFYTLLTLIPQKWKQWTFL